MTGGQLLASVLGIWLLLNVVFVVLCALSARWRAKRRAAELMKTNLTDKTRSV